jgi:hypothetical protein
MEKAAEEKASSSSSKYKKRGPLVLWGVQARPYGHMQPVHWHGTPKNAGHMVTQVSIQFLGKLIGANETHGMHEMEMPIGCCLALRDREQATILLIQKQQWQDLTHKLKQMTTFCSSRDRGSSHLQVLRQHTTTTQIEGWWSAEQMS